MILYYDIYDPGDRGTRWPSCPDPAQNNTVSPRNYLVWVTNVRKQLCFSQNPTTTSLSLSVSLSLACHADHHVWMFCFLKSLCLKLFECFWRFLKLYIWNRMHALHVDPIWRMIQEVSASWTIQVSQACRHTFWHFTLKKNWRKRFYSTSTGRSLKLKDFNIPSGSFWSCTAQQFLAIFGAASRRWKGISNIPMLDSQPWSIAFNFLQWL